MLVRTDDLSKLEDESVRYASPGLLRIGRYPRLTLIVPSQDGTRSDESDHTT